MKVTHARSFNEAHSEETREYITELLQEIIALQAALKKALDGWADVGGGEVQDQRITELRKLIP